MARAKVRGERSATYGARPDEGQEQDGQAGRFRGGGGAGGPPGQDEAGGQGDGDGHAPGIEVAAGRGGGGAHGDHEAEGQWVLQDRGEHDGGDQGSGDAAEDPAEGDPQVELGQAVGRGSQFGEAGVGQRGRGEEEDQVRDQDQPHRVERGGERGGQGHGQQGDGPPGEVDQPSRGAAEGEHEAEQVQGQGHDPQQRDGGDVGAQVPGHPEQEQAGDEAEADQAQAQPASQGGRRRPGVDGTDAGAGPAAEGPRAGPGEQDEGQVPDAPEPALGRGRQVGLEEQGVGQQGQETADVAGGVQEVRVGGVAVPTEREPALEGRAGRGEGQEGQADGDGEDQQGPQSRGGALGQAPTGRHGQGQGQHRDGHEHDVDGDLAPPEPAGAQVGDAVAEEEGGLEEHHGGVPDVRGAPQSRGQELGDEGLDQEQQGGADEAGEGEQEDEASAGGHGLRRDRGRRVDVTAGDHGHGALVGGDAPTLSGRAARWLSQPVGTLPGWPVKIASRWWRTSPPRGISPRPSPG